MQLTIVRHAYAGNKRKWHGPDLVRPIDGCGLRQAGTLATRLAVYPIGRLISSPSHRCVQTLQPLAEIVHLPIEIWDGLAHDADGSELASRIGDDAFQDAVLCTHGEVMRPLLARSDLRSLAVKRAIRPRSVLAKGSAWQLRASSDGRVTRFRYLDAKS